MTAYISTSMYIFCNGPAEAQKLRGIFQQLNLRPEVGENSFKFAPVDIAGPMYDEAFSAQFTAAVRGAGGRFAGGPWAQSLNAQGDAAAQKQKPKMKP